MFLALPLSGNAKKRAFLIGISKYRANGRTAWVNIHGKEDVDSLAPALTKKGFSVTTLVNEQATYQGIVTSLKGLISDTKKGDVVFIHFSCHGQPVEDGLLKGYLKDEKDGYDEAIVPIDAGKVYSPNGYKGEKHLIDDELNGYIKSLRTKIGPKGMLYITIDACHAGESSRKGIETVRGTNEALTSHASKKYNPPRTNVRHYQVEKGVNLSPVLFIEACQSRERNTEIRVNGKEYRTYVSKKVPRDKTLTAVFDGYLDDILYPATIVGKRVRYPVGKTRTYKVIVDPLDKELVEDRIPAITACYKAITNRKLEVQF